MGQKKQQGVRSLLFFVATKLAAWKWKKKGKKIEVRGLQNRREEDIMVMGVSTRYQ
ncbi:hypothetical protein [Salinithrix halophila]|uniref:Uncharacterized protein n=1 Tax=Salinithrix halophila TaxID=1485204 RepID=A0ABV8J8R1_9BACL